MKRWLVAVLVLLALIVLISPGIVGRLAERNMEAGIDWAESESPGVNITTESFERGWFTSEGRHRVVFEGGQFRDAAAKYAEATGNPEFISLVIETRLDHGLVPVSSLSRDAGSLSPGLASTVSTFEIDPGNGELVPLPGTLYSKVSLTGASNSRFLLETGFYAIDDVNFNWEGADMSIFADPANGDMAVHGTISPWTVSGADGRAEIGAISIDADQRRTDYGFNVGPVSFSVDTISVEEQSNRLTIGGISVNADSGIENGRLHTSGSLEVKDITVPGFGEVAVAMDMSMNRFDAASFGAVVAAFQEAQGAADPELALQMIYPTIADDLQALAAAGAEFKFNTLNVTLPQGTIAMSLAVEVAEADPDEAFSWPGVLLAMTASLDLRIPAKVFDFVTAMNPQAGSLLAMGLLEREGDDYVMAAEYAQGLVNVNGAPMPIPIPGM